MLRLTVVTPQRAFLDEECLNVTLPGLLGEMQILEGHVPSLVELKTGMVSFDDKKGEQVRFVIAQGFAEIEAEQVVILCELARHRAEVDKSSEEALQQSLLEQINIANKEHDDLKKLKANLEISVASLNLLE
jgi:ATP synthase F1 epsilon subunit